MSEATLLERIDLDLKQAMRDKNEVDKLALRAMKTALTLARTETSNHNLADAEAIGVLQKLAKKRRDTAVEYEKLGRPEQAQAELAEMTVIERYLPRALNEAEVEELARAVIAARGATSAREIGAVMGDLMPKVAGRADGKLVNQVVRRLLGS